MKRILFLFILLTAIILFSFTAIGIIQVSVSVDSNIDGYIPFSEIPSLVNNTYQKFTVVWGNTGSVSCKLRIRSDIYKKSKNRTILLYSAWSKEVPSEPGTEYTLNSYWYPEEAGNFTVRTKIYYCNLIIDGPAGNFTVIKENISTNKTKILDIKISTNKSIVEFDVTPRDDIDNILITPKSYPMGWIFESREIDHINKGETKNVRINYEPSIWKRRNITFMLVSKDNSIIMEKTIELKEGEKGGLPLGLEYLYIIIVLILLIIILILFIMLFRNRTKTKNDS